MEENRMEQNGIKWSKSEQNKTEQRDSNGIKQNRRQKGAETEKVKVRGNALCRNHTNKENEVKMKRTDHLVVVQRNKRWFGQNKQK